MPSIAKIVKQFKQDWADELSSESIAGVCHDCGMNWINSLLTPVVTVQLFLLQIVQWLKNPNAKPGWMSDEQFASLPTELTVRELRYCVHRNGFRVQQVTIVTTLLDETVYSKEDLAQLYRNRWEIETNLRHLKTTMKMEFLKCKTVDGVLRELHMFALVYNLVRQVMVEAARHQQVAVQQISFIDAMRWLKAARLGDSLTSLVVLPNRPDRVEPRVKKRRHKNYRYMIQSRKLLAQKLNTK